MTKNNLKEHLEWLLRSNPIAIPAATRPFAASIQPTADPQPPDGIVLDHVEDNARDGLVGGDIIQGNREIECTRSSIPSNTQKQTEAMARLQCAPRAKRGLVSQGSVVPLESLYGQASASSEDSRDQRREQRFHGGHHRFELYQRPKY